MNSLQQPLSNADTLPSDHVYVLKAENGLYKIGWSNNVWSRMGDAAMAPVDISLVHSIRTDNARGIESGLHRLLAPLRVRGEWFRLPSDILQTLRSVPELPWRDRLAWAELADRIRRSPSLTEVQRTTMEVRREVFVHLTVAGRVCGVNERTLQGWMRGYTQYRTHEGYPPERIVEVMHSHGVEVSVAELEDAPTMPRKRRVLGRIPPTTPMAPQPVAAPLPSDSAVLEQIAELRKEVQTLRGMFTAMASAILKEGNSHD